MYRSSKGKEETRWVLLNPCFRVWLYSPQVGHAICRTYAQVPVADSLIGIWPFFLVSVSGDWECVHSPRGIPLLPMMTDEACRVE